MLATETITNSPKESPVSPMRFLRVHSESGSEKSLKRSSHDSSLDCITVSSWNSNLHSCGSELFPKNTWNSSWFEPFLAASYPESAKNVVRAAVKETEDTQTQEELESSFLCFVTRNYDVNTEMKFHGIVDDSFVFDSDSKSKWTLLKLGGNGRVVHYIPPASEKM